ncbi:MAG: aspartyl/asparaginyl beta-hydroxylase domain-containing protein [Chitinophagales bacterium]|nr:aspartyl/asparaginyl beta-hydroxylase domain-containing protein [Chitinophagales bacterium]
MESLQDSNSLLTNDVYSTEPIYYTYRGKWYKGHFPTYYDSHEFRFNKDFEDNYLTIKQEFESYYSHSKSKIKTFYIPHDFTIDGWKILTIWGYVNHKIFILRHFPTIKKLLKKYPEIISMQISILQPNTRIKAHFGGSNALVRHHLGIHIPGKAPDLGFNLKGEVRVWEEGKVLSFCESHRHYVWNFTNQNRVILMYDSIHPLYKKEKHSVVAGVTSILIMVILLKKLPWLGKVSPRLEILLHKILSACILPIFIIRDIVKRPFM